VEAATNTILSCHSFWNSYTSFQYKAGAYGTGAARPFHGRREQRREQSQVAAATAAATTAAAVGGASGAGRAGRAASGASGAGRAAGCPSAAPSATAPVLQFRAVAPGRCISIWRSIRPNKRSHVLRTLPRVPARPIVFKTHCMFISETNANTRRAPARMVPSVCGHCG
jgi:hypothetical protein